MSNKHDHRGFTLIEAVLALAIFLIGALAILHFLPMGLKLAMAGRYQTQAAFLAQGKMEQYLALPYDGLETGVVEERQAAISDPASQLHSFEVQAEIHHVDGDLNEVSEDEGMKKIEVTVYWQEGVREKEKHLITLVSKY